MYNGATNHHNVLTLYTQILDITNRINTIDVTDLNLKQDMQITRDHIIKIITKVEMQSQLIDQDMCKNIWNVPYTAKPYVVPTPPVSPVMSHESLPIPFVAEKYFSDMESIAENSFMELETTTNTLQQSTVALQHVPDTYGPIDKKKVVVPDKYTHRIVYFKDNYGVEWRPATKKSINVANIDELIQSGVVFCHHKITKELFKLVIKNQTLFVAVDHTVYYHNVEKNTVEKLKNKRNKYFTTDVLWISAMKINDTYLQGYLNRVASCIITRDNYLTLSVQNYVLF